MGRKWTDEERAELAEKMRQKWAERRENGYERKKREPKPKEEPKPKRPRGRPRLPPELKQKHVQSRAKLIENAQNGILPHTDKMAKIMAIPGGLEESKKALAEVLYEASLPKVRSDEELYQRFVEYFQRCSETGRIPTVEECMLCTGYSYIYMHKIQTGERQPGWSSDKTPEIIVWATEICRTYDAKMVMAGKIPQVPYIFRSKNLYGMKDQADVQVVNIAPEKVASLTDIAKRYGLETTFVEDES